MELLISENIFLEIPKITQIETFKTKIEDYNVVNNELTSNISIDLSYYNDLLENVFEVLNIPFISYLKEDMIISDLEIEDMTLEVVDNRGINCFYSINIFYDLKTFREEQEEIVLIKEEKQEEFKDISKKEQAINESLKEEIKENYDNLLSQSLKNEDVSVISTKGRSDELDFLSFFASMKDEYSSLKKIFIRNESEIDNISKKYNIPLQELYKTYDKENNYVYIIDGQL